jgi:hypothetical protein
MTQPSRARLAGKARLVRRTTVRSPKFSELRVVPVRVYCLSRSQFTRVPLLALAARQAFAKISTESVADELIDVTAVTDAMTQASEKVQALEVALKVALQRQKAAETSLKNAEMEVRREDAREKLTRQQEAGRRIDRTLDRLAPEVCEFNRLSKEVTDLGNDELNRRTGDARREFIVWLFRACPDMPGCRTGVEPFQTDARWKAPWSDRLPTPDLVDEAIR